MEFDAFTDLMDRLLFVPHSEIQRCVEGHRKAAAKNPNRRSKSIARRMPTKPKARRMNTCEKNGRNLPEMNTYAKIPRGCGSYGYVQVPPELARR